MRSHFKLVFFFLLPIGGAMLTSCGRHATSSERTTFTQGDSLTETYLVLQDTLLHTWNLVIREEEEKRETMDKVIQHLLKMSAGDRTQLTSLATRFEQLNRLHITPKTLTNHYVVEEHDFAAKSLVSEILSLAESNPGVIGDKGFSKLIDRIKVADQRTSVYRSGYDSIARQFNNFLKTNRLFLLDLEKNGGLEARPTFGRNE